MDSDSDDDRVSGGDVAAVGVSSDNALGDLDLPPLPERNGGDETDALAALLAMSGLNDAPAYVSSLDSVPLGELPDAGSGRAADAAETQRSRHLAALLAQEALKYDDDVSGGPEPIPLVLDASGLPEGVRRKGNDTFNVEELLRAAKAQVEHAHSGGSGTAAAGAAAEAAPGPDVFDGGDVGGADDGVVDGAAAAAGAGRTPESRAEAERLLALLTAKMRQRAAAEADDAAAYAELLRGAGAGAEAVSGADDGSGSSSGDRKRPRDPPDWRTAGGGSSGAR